MRGILLIPNSGYSSLFHLEGLPPLCLLHGKDDELSPFTQSVQLAEELTRRDMPHEFYAYDVLMHYFSIEADNATAQQLFHDSLACLRKTLVSECVGECLKHSPTEHRSVQVFHGPTASQPGVQILRRHINDTPTLYFD